MIEDILLFIRQNIGPLIALGSAFIAWFALKANHDWSRRNCALQFMADWNAKTAPHRKAIEEIFPGLIDKDKKAVYQTELTKEIARNIYTSKQANSTSQDAINSPQPDYWKARFHLMELGNHMECVSSAYINNVADRKMIEVAFKAPMVRWHSAMENFISEVSEHRGYRPWKPWDDLVQEWSKEPQKKWRKKTA
jgi:hypothetical protein